MQNSLKYIGRFAPSPTGELHLGSLITAIASYLRARSQNGKWLLRIEDVDLTRVQKGSVNSILKALESHGLQWDNEIIYQSKRSHIYLNYLEVLKKKNITYRCICSRNKMNKYLKNPITLEYIYPGHCRGLFIENSKNNSFRINTNDSFKISFVDKIQGKIEQNIEGEVGDYILWRNENFASYQFAVVIDDELQGITEVLRGSDLLLQTPRQIYLQKCLDFNMLEYLHIPVMLNEFNQKLSKQTKAKPIRNEIALENIFNVLIFLGYSKELIKNWKHEINSVDDLIYESIKFFNIENIPKKLGINIKA
jgi:glutamyl-Q tRNA(Asp) synthetase